MKCLLSITFVLAVIMIAIFIKMVVSNDCDGTAGVYIDCSESNAKVTLHDNDLKLVYRA